MSSMENDAGKYFLHTVALYTHCVSFIADSMLFAHLAPTAPLANILQSLMLSLAFTFSGLAIFKPELPKGYLWLFAMLPLRHINEMITMSQLKCEPLLQCGPTVAVPTPEGDVFVHLAQLVTQMTGFSFDYYWSAFGWVCLYIGTVVLLGLAATHYLNHSSK